MIFENGFIQCSLLSVGQNEVFFFFFFEVFLLRVSQAKVMAVVLRAPKIHHYTKKKVQEFP